MPTCGLSLTQTDFETETELILVMTTLLEKAFKKAQELPEAEQNRVAEWLLFELEDDAKWDASFAASSGALAQLAAEALTEHRAGQTEPSNLKNLK
jgi:squalene cyclase